MMRLIILITLLTICSYSYGQQDERITTIGFVQILNDNKQEATYYYQNNWLVLRKMAIKKGYIDSFQILETPISESAPFELMLITTYMNEAQHLLREEHFEELIKEKGPLKLLNDKEPGEFRKTLFNKEGVRHWQ
jgi:hypothetical protein